LTIRERLESAVKGEKACVSCGKHERWKKEKESAEDILIEGFFKTSRPLWKSQSIYEKIPTTPENYLKLKLY